MAEEEAKTTEESTGQPEPAAGPAAEPVAVAADTKDVEEGKVFAVLSYVLTFLGLPFFLIPLIMRNNNFSLYHAKQCLMIWLLGIVGGALSGVLMAVCVGAILLILVVVAFYVLAIIGLINSAKGATKPLPLIGKWGEEWFKGLKKA